MIRMYARMVPVLIDAWRHRHDGQLRTRTQARVHWDQVDLNRHMNQSRYPEHFERGRADWLVRSGAWMRWRASGANPVVARQEITYRRELGPGQRFVVDTRAIGIEGRLLHTRGLMLVGDRIHASADVWLIFVGSDGVLAPEQVEGLCGSLLVEPLAVHDWRLASEHAVD